MPKEHLVMVQEDDNYLKFDDKLLALEKVEELKKRFPTAEFFVCPYVKAHYQIWTKKGTYFGGSLKCLQ